MQWQKFQFPTWWNSIHALSANAKVEEGFNSQRDGILHRGFWAYIKHYPVSIPNGMEFYTLGRSEEARANEFQFPTGWNSTRT